MTAGAFAVSGPGAEARPAPTEGAAISLAQTLALQAERGDWYVRDEQGATRYRVTAADNVVYTTPMNGGQQG